MTALSDVTAVREAVADVLADRCTPAVLEDADGSLFVSRPGEIVTAASHSFYSYDAKYIDADGAVVKVPAELPPEVEAAIDKRSSMSAIGNLNDYVKFQMAEGMAKGGSSGGAATELAVGMAIAQQMIKDQGGFVPGAGAPAGAPAGAAAPPPVPAAAQLLTPADAARRSSARPSSWPAARP